MVKYTFLFFLIISVQAMANTVPLADPTKPLDFKATSVKRKQRIGLPKLQSILVQGKQRQAIINNTLYIAGQRVNGYRITQIKKDTVILHYKNRSYILTLFNSKEHFIK